MNTKLLRKIQRHIKKRGVFDMDKWSIDEPLQCGCIGHFAHWFGERKTGDGSLGRRDLGLEPSQNSRLIHLHLWPDKFQRMYNRNPSKAGVARIEHFIKTKGQE